VLSGSRVRLQPGRRPPAYRQRSHHSFANAAKRESRPSAVLLGTTRESTARRSRRSCFRLFSAPSGSPRRAICTLPQTCSGTMRAVSRFSSTLLQCRQGSRVPRLPLSAAAASRRALQCVLPSGRDPASSPTLARSQHHRSPAAVPHVVRSRARALGPAPREQGSVHGSGHGPCGLIAGAATLSLILNGTDLLVDRHLAPERRDSLSRFGQEGC
jgi:hypothetical protein